MLMAVMLDVITYSSLELLLKTTSILHRYLGLGPHMLTVCYHDEHRTRIQFLFWLAVTVAGLGPNLRHSPQF